MSEIFFLPPEGFHTDGVLFPRGESRHIHRSCRRGPGDRIRATDGCGTCFTIEIVEAGERIRGRILEERAVEPASPVIALAAGVGKRERMSWLVEKGTEIGMAAFHPLITAWSEAHRPRSAWGQPVERWRRVAVAALKQSQRCHLPEIHTPEPLVRFLERAPDHGECRILLDRGPESRPLGELLGRGSRRFLVVLGPEGGLTPEEVSRVAGAGFARGRLIDRPLRFETAGVFAMALIAARARGDRNEEGEEG